MWEKCGVRQKSVLISENVSVMPLFEPSIFDQSKQLMVARCNNYEQLSSGSQFCIEVDIVCLAVNIMLVVGVCVCVRKYAIKPAKNPEPILQKLGV